MVSAGHALPSNLVANADLEKLMDTNDEWIQTRTGIKQRYFCESHENTFTLAVDAAKSALHKANLSARDIDMVVVATTSPNLTFPSVATQVQAALGMEHGAAFDVQAVCSGFIYALSTAENYLRLNKANRVLVIGAETLSRLLDMEDRTTAVLFGDGAGAVILENTEGEECFYGTDIYSDGRHCDLLRTSGGVGSDGGLGVITMNGREVFKQATRALAGLVDSMLEKHNMSEDQIDFLVPHQANRRIIEATAKHLGLSMDKVVVTVDKHANTSAASIPLALSESIDAGVIKRGDTLLLEAFGGGFTWGAALLKY